MYPKYWFRLGFAYLQIKDWDQAASAFTKVVNQEPEHGQAWNNLAAVHLHQKNWKFAYIALQQCVRFNRNSWEVWDNFCTCCLQLQEFAEACYAVEMLIAVSGKSKIDLNVISVICDSVYENCIIHSPTGVSSVILRDKVDKLLALVSDTIPLEEKFWKIFINYYSKLFECAPLSEELKISTLEKLFRGHIQRARSLIEGDWDARISEESLNMIIAQFDNFSEFCNSVTEKIRSVDFEIVEKYATAELQVKSVLERSEKFFKKTQNYSSLHQKLLNLRDTFESLLKNADNQSKPVVQTKDEFYSSESNSLWL
jgi:tetratricopeptide (TPR) repeat protein